MKFPKKYYLLLLLLMVFFLVSCNKKEEVELPKNQVSPTSYKSEVGMLNWKTDNSKLELMDREKILLEYFDSNYFSLSKYEHLQRYPEAYEGIQLQFLVEVTKILSYEGNDYEALAKVITFGKDDYERDNQKIVIKGKTTDGRILEKDNVLCYGRYEEVKSYTIDAETIYLPTVLLHRIIIDNSLVPSFIRFDEKSIKNVAKAMFGEDVKVRNAEYEVDFVFDEEHDSSDRFMIATLDNQSNANFSKYEIYQQYGYIRDSNSTSNISRYINVSSDFSHYLLSIYDKKLKEFTLEYYDSTFNKIWSKEFEEVGTPSYDYTIDKIYTVANNELYIIDINTGKEVSKPIFIGSKVAITKVEEGIILFANSAADAIMKTNDKGEIIWKINLSKKVQYVGGFQIKDNGYVVASVYYENEELSSLIVIDEKGNKVLEISN